VSRLLAFLAGAAMLFGLVLLFTPAQAADRQHAVIGSCGAPIGGHGQSGLPLCGEARAERLRVGIGVTVVGAAIGVGAVIARRRGITDSGLTVDNRRSG
jgi:hypothetical protein